MEGPDDRDAVVASIETVLEDHGFDVERVDYDDEHDAVVVQYATIVGEADEIERVLKTDIPKTVGAFQGPILETGETERYANMVVLVVNSRTTPEERTGKLRWEIAGEWLPEDDDISAETYEQPLQRVLSTAAVVTEEGVHDLDTTFEFTDR